MEFPPRVREKIEQLVQGEDIRAMTLAAKSLSENYRREAHVSASARREILAYCAVRMPATFGAVCRALELSLECFDGELNSVLDTGAGTGSAALAAQMLTDCEEITCLERDKTMLELGKTFAENARWIRRDITEGIAESADLVICSYCLNELSEAQRKEVTAKLANAAEKLLLIVEPGTPKSFGLMKKTREQLIGMGLKIAAPCPSDGVCPLSEDDWCHFTARVARSKLHKLFKGGDAPYEDEKFCFLAAVHGEPDRALSRILRHPVIESGKITLRLCGGDGISEKLVTRSSPLFKKARKSEIGDAFPKT